MHHLRKELRIHGPVPAPVTGIQNSRTPSDPKSLRSSTFVFSQTVHSFVKNEYAPQVLPKLNGKIMSELISYAAKLNIKLTINKDNANLLHMD
jgi:hypothetical protein